MAEKVSGTQDELTKDLEALYSRIDSEGRAAILNGREKIDPFLNYLEQDRRLGLTLMISINGELTAKFKDIMEEIQAIEPEQYFYPGTDFHVTIIDFISATENFQRDDHFIQASAAIVEKAIHGLSVFPIRFQGIITSNAAVLAKGYYGPRLLQLRERIRENAFERGIELKERYQSISAHSTLVRFKSNIRNREKLAAIIQKYNQLDMGIIQVNEFELVIHDWYNRKKEEIKKFILSIQPDAEYEMKINDL